MNRKLYGSLAGLALVFSLAAACPNASTGDSNERSPAEIEDCDAEDWRNYDPECGRGPSPKPMKTAKQPAPKPSKRR